MGENSAIFEPGTNSETKKARRWDCGLTVVLMVSLMCSRKIRWSDGVVLSSPLVRVSVVIGLVRDSVFVTPFSEEIVE